MGLVDFDAVNKRALASLEYLLRQWMPGGKKRGNEYICGDWNGGKGDSLSINLKTGKGGDFADEVVGDPIGIYSKIFKCDRVQAARKLAGLFNMEGGIKDNEIIPYTEIPVNTPAQEEDENRQRQEKLEKILSECIPVKSTPAQEYLKSRGIKGCPKEIFKFRPRKKGDGGSLICIAKDENGLIRAVQSVYLTAEGKKADIKIQKRTNGFPSGTPIRIPGKNPGGPVLLTEGPEDALTLRQATGLEVWCSMGLTFMGKVPVDKERALIVVRDNDEPGSKPDLAISEILAGFIDSGVKNLLCARPPQSIKDSNMLLLTSGEQAVIEMINNAQPVKDAREIDPEAPKGPIDYNDYGEPVYEDEEEEIFRRCAFMPHTDSGNSARIKMRWGNIVKFAPGIGWMVYSHGKWEPELADLRVIKMAKVTAMEIQRESSYVDEHIKDTVKKWSKRSQGGSAIKYALMLSQPELAVRSKMLDQNHYLFNCANGIIDLKTGRLMPHSPEHLCTKQSSVAYDPKAQCPNWMNFLKSIFPEHEELLPFIRRAVGYSLTGDTREQCIFIMHGKGSNGKSTFLDTLQSISSDYWVKTKADAFMEKERGGSEANPFLAMLRGARFVTASETKSDRLLDESLIKEATGDSFMTVRNLHQNPITFQPQFKLWLATNHKPEIRGTDEGIWRRLKLIPFTAQFYDPEDADAPIYGPFKDKMLLAKLKADLPGILTWAVQGCLEWQKEGLNPPQIVLDATNEYRSEMDVIGSYLEERTERLVGHILSCTDLYNNYKDWCENNGHFAMSKIKFSRRLYERGIEKGRTRTGDKGYSGITLKTNNVW